MPGLRDMLRDGDHDALQALERPGDSALLQAVADAAPATLAALEEEGVAPEELEQVRLDDALVLASGIDAWGVVDALVASGARIGGRDRWGQTAMHLAACRSSDAVRALLTRGADARLRDWQFTSTPVGWADFFQQPAQRDLLLEHAELDPIDCVVHRRFDHLGRLLAQDPELVDGPVYRTEAWVARVMRRHHGGRPHAAPEGMRLGGLLRACAQRGDTDGVGRLLDLGARPDHSEVRTGTFERPWLGRSALAWGVERSYARLCQLLRDAGATLSLVDAAILGELDAGAGGSADDALFVAALHGHVATTKALLERGADPNGVAAFDQQQRTPLVAAMPHGAPLVRILLQAGADPDQPVLFGETARDRVGADPDLQALLAPGA